MRAVRYAGGVFARSRAVHAADDVARPRSTPESQPLARAPEATSVKVIAGFVTPDFRSVYRYDANTNPSTAA